MIKRQPFILILLLVSILLSQAVRAKVASTTLEELISLSDLILIGNDSEGTVHEKWKIGNVQVSQVLKGPQDINLAYYLAAPSWTCDISESRPGEQVLLFLEAIHPPKDVNPQRSARPPSTFQQQPLYVIAWSGRGRMPIRSIDGLDYATAWVNDVRLPNHFTTIDGPNSEYSFIRSTPLPQLQAYITQALTRNAPAL